MAITARSGQEALTRPDGSAIRILTVDDEPSLTELLSMAMRYEGWEVYTATSGTEAVRVAREVQPDALVLDDAKAPDIAWVARLGLIADPDSAPPRPLYLKEPETTPQDKARLPRR